MHMITTLAERSYQDAMDAPRSGDRKNYATSVAIMLDKWTIVSGRPTVIVGSADVQREGSIELAHRLAAIARGA